MSILRGTCAPGDDLDQAHHAGGIRSPPPLADEAADGARGPRFVRPPHLPTGGGQHFVVGLQRLLQPRGAHRVRAFPRSDRAGGILQQPAPVFGRVRASRAGRAPCRFPLIQPSLLACIPPRRQRSHRSSGAVLAGLERKMASCVEAARRRIRIGWSNLEENQSRRIQAMDDPWIGCRTCGAAPGSVGWTPPEGHRAALAGEREARLPGAPIAVPDAGWPDGRLEGA